jgi:DNA-binding transcriptional LysR family regulator
VEVARRAARGEVGTLNVGYAAGVEIEILPRVLRAFARRYPAVDLRLAPLHSREQLDALRQRRIDVGFVRLPLSAADLQIERFHREPLVFVASRDHPLARRRNVRLRDLADVPYIQLGRAYSPVFCDVISGLTRAAGVSLRVAAESAHLYDNLSLVAAGVGVSLLPNGVRRFRRKGLVYRPVGPPRVMLEIGLARRRDDLSQVAAAFIDTVRGLYARGR